MEDLREVEEIRRQDLAQTINKNAGDQEQYNGLAFSSGKDNEELITRYF